MAQDQNASAPAWGLGIALGVGVGVALGVALGNIGIGIAIGAGLGVAFAVAFGASSHRKPDADSTKPPADPEP